MGKVDCSKKERSPYTMQALESLFTKALKLEQPWMITKVEFDEVGGAIRVFIDFPRGSMFSCPVCWRSIARQSPYLGSHAGRKPLALETGNCFLV
jgi:hypothetical protein